MSCAPGGVFSITSWGAAQKLDYVCIRCICARVGDSFRLGEEGGRNVPVLSVVGDYGDGLFVVARHGSNQIGAPRWPESYFLANTEVEHLGMRAHLVEKAEPSHDFVV